MRAKNGTDAPLLPLRFAELSSGLEVSAAPMVVVLVASQPVTGSLKERRAMTRVPLALPC